MSHCFALRQSGSMKKPKLWVSKDLLMFSLAVRGNKAEAEFAFVHEMACRSYGDIV